MRVQVYKLPNVRKVLILTDTARVERGMSLTKVKSPPGMRPEILETVGIFHGSVVDVSEHSMIIAVRSFDSPWPCLMGHSRSSWRQRERCLVNRHGATTVV